MAPLASWFAALLIAGVALPLTFRVFRRFPDAGAGLAFVLGLVVASWAYFLLRTFGVLDPGRGGALVTVLLLALASAVVARPWPSTCARLAPRWPLVVAMLGIYTAAFFAFASVRSYSPEIAGTEQPMDLMYLTSAMRSPDYPPEDLWLAGEPASYYYFGYVQAGFLAQLSGAAPGEAYTAGLANVFAASAAAMASLALALARWIGPRRRRFRRPALAAGLAIGVLLFTGTLAGVFEWAAAHGHQDETVFRLAGLDYRISCEVDPREGCYPGPPGGRTTAWYPTEFFWWFGLTRVIPGTITEVPAFSFLLGDLHPHVMSIPLALLAIALAVATARGRGRLWAGTHRRPVAGLLAAVILGALAFENAWDLPTFGALFTLSVAARNLRRAPFRRATVDTLGYVVPVAVLALVSYLPWWLDFSSQAEGLRPYVGHGTRPAHALLQFGVPLALAVAALAVHPPPGERSQRLDVAAWTLWVPALPFLAWVASAAALGDLGAAAADRTLGGWVTLAGYGVLTWALAAWAVLHWLAGRPAAVALALCTVGALLLLGAELFLVRDIFFGNLPRMNTVFKLSYQAWILLAAGGVASLAAALSELSATRPGRPHPRPVAALLALGVIAVGAIYPLTATFARTDGFAGPTELDGLAFVARNDPAEYALMRWIAGNVPAGAVIIEATGRTWAAVPGGPPRLVAPGGGDYTDAGRVAARTGRPTYIGWVGHELQWRGSSPENSARFTARQDLVDSIYTAPDAATALARLRDTGARYLVLGSLELHHYPAAVRPRFDEAMDTVFSSGELHVFADPAR